jgi:SNF2 family DNA or RNA helicase
MTESEISLSLSEGVLQLSSSNELSPLNRLFLVNIAGFVRTEEAGRYIKRATGEAIRSIGEVIGYFQSKHFNVVVDRPIQDILDSRASAKQVLEKSRIVGAQLRDAPPPAVACSPEFIRKLKPYQMPAVEHLLRVPNAANFSVPGSGKTTMLFAAYSALKADQVVDRLLIVGPGSCFAPWSEEFEGCFGRKPSCIRLSGSPAERTALYGQLAAGGEDFSLITYATLANDSAEIATLLQRFKFMLVLDESHYVKRLSGGLWAKTVRDIAPLAARRVILSGTPVPNGILDIWSQMTFLWPDPPLLGTQDQFRDRINRGGDHITEQVRDELTPFFWRVKKSDVDLPPPVFHRISVTMRPFQASIYGALGAKVLADVVSQPSERQKLRRWRTAKMVRLLQAASNPSLLSERSLEFKLPPLSGGGLAVSEIIENYSQYEAPAKLDAAVELVRKLIQAGEKVVLWSAFVHNLNTLENLLKEYRPRIIHGDIPRDSLQDVEVNRERLIEQFKTSDSFPLLIANPGACAESISLHRVCKHAIYLDRTFNGAQYMQSLDRLHRLGLGSADKVHYYILNAANTVDEIIDSRLEAKQQKLSELLEGDFSTINFDDESVSEPDEEAADFHALVEQLRSQFGPPKS